MRRLALLALAVAVLAAGCGDDSTSPLTSASDDLSPSLMAAAPTATYEVTIQNMSTGQPLSPPVVATHRPAISMFKVGGFASPGLEKIAEDGDPAMMFNALSGNKHVHDAVNVGMPLTRMGTTVEDFMDHVTLEIDARPGDRISFATMLICTNDGFTGLDSARLPREGTAEWYTYGYDAGTEDNTEASEDIVDPASALGPVALDGDPNGNEDAAVDTSPRMHIRMHPGIQGGADLDPAQHGWSGPVAKITVTRIN